MHLNTEDEITFMQGVSFIKKRLKIIVLFTSIIFIFSIIYALFQPNIYRSSGIYEIADSNESSSPIEAQGLSSIAGAVGVSLGKPSSNKSDVIIETIKSKGFLLHLLNIEGVFPSLFAIDYYDPQSQKIILDQSLYSKNKWTNGIPSIHQAHLIYEKSISIRRDNKDGFIYIHFAHQSPYFAEEFLSLIVSEINATMRVKAAKESSKSIKFLTEEFTETNWLEIRNSISSLLQKQFETQMIANVREEYALKPIESPFVEEDKFSPSRLSIVLWWTLGSLIISIMIAFFVEAFRYLEDKNTS
ncbi:hypothetical protein N9Y96_01175 [Gammaproteobacteria bacterium]|nr:hypothetical protein [Gammaproteobacteria bacterium]MDB9842366.1 hypothetical protein [Gammaproteobacteria bacterium]